MSNFKMQMRPGGASAVAHASDVLVLPKGKECVRRINVQCKAAAFVLLLFDESLNLIREAIQVSIDGGVAIGMGDVERFAIAAGFDFDARDIACGGSVNLVADLPA